jgi:Xaa-Pro aminopeptidase
MSSPFAGSWRRFRAVPDARPRRIAALRDRLVDAHLDGLLVSGLPNIRYLTGFSGSNALLLVSARELLLLTDFRYETQVAAEVGDLAQVRIETVSLWKGLRAALKDLPAIAVCGFEAAHLSHRDFQRLIEDGGRLQWRPVTDLVEGLRIVKDDAERETIRAAAAIAIEALECTLREVGPGLTELQVTGILERHLRESGSEFHPFPVIVASGPRSALPHAHPGRRTIAPGDFLLLDFGAVVDGYCSDITRTVVLGKASARQREVYEAVRDANSRARAGVRSGMLGKEADALARDVLAARGYGEGFGHGLGHGLGLEVHEPPRLSRISEEVLPARAVVTIEPGVYVPDWGGVRIEDDVSLDDEGSELLTHFPRELLELN